MSAASRRVERKLSEPIRSRDLLIWRVLYDSRISDIGSVGRAFVAAARKEAQK